MQELIVQIFDGKILNIKEVQAAFAGLKNGKHLLTLKDYRRRSISQNAYYWAVVVPLVRKGLYDNGFDAITTNEEAHQVMKRLFLKKDLVSKQTGDVIDVVGKSSKLSVSEFAEYIEEICRWAAEYLNIVIPSPNEQMADFDDYARIVYETNLNS